MKISIIIPNYNGIRLLEKNLPCVLKAISGEEIIVVDDASTDGSIMEIKYQISNIKNTNKKVKIKLIQNEKNLGFASTVNRGVEDATGELIVLLNTDVVPESNFLALSVTHFSDPKIFAVGFLQKCPENGKVILRGRGLGKFEKGFLFHSRGAVSDKDTSDGVLSSSKDSSEVEDFRKTLWVCGGAGIFRKSIWEELGGMETLYNPFYWEDIDLSYRAQKAGYKVLFEPKSVVIHERKLSVINKSYSDDFIKTISYRNQILFVWLNITDIGYLIEHLIFLPFYLFKSLLSDDKQFFHGFIVAVKLLPQVIKRRSENTRSGRISDKKLLMNL